MALQAVMRLVRDGTLIGGGDAVVIGDYIVADPGDVTGPPGSILEPLDSGLLLVEEFDRLDIEDRDELAAWVARRGPFEFEPNRENTRRPSEARILEDSPMSRDDFLEYLEAMPHQHGPHPSFRQRAAAAPDGPYMGEHGYIVDAIADVRIHHKQIQDWLPTLVDPDPAGFKMTIHSLRVPVPPSKQQSFRVWLLGQHLENLVTDALDFLVTDVSDGRDEGIQYGVEVSWTSVLQPMYVQIFMAYLRALDGKRAAARCRDCGQVFLILDGRRSTYCNAKCRNRFNVRAFRTRAKEATDGS
jgi:hypothetical protein